MSLKNLQNELLMKILTANLSQEEYTQVINHIDKIKNNTQQKGIVEFTEKEIETMPKNIKRLLTLDKKKCHLRTRTKGNSVSYEIRYRRDGYNVTACGKTIELAKINFLNKCKDLKIIDPSGSYIPSKFDDFAQFYFENFRKEKVSPLTFKTDMSRYNIHILPFFKQISLRKITPVDCKKLLDKLKTEGKGKTADEVYSLLNVIFKSAIAHGLIERNPLDIVLHIQHQRNSGSSLTKGEEQRLKLALKGSQYLSFIMLLLYTGLRPNELKTAKIDGNFIVAENSKRKNKKVEYKKIPILKALEPYLPIPQTIPHLNKLRELVRTALPNHILYDLRTTFYSRCDEYGVSPVARDEFVGHSSGALTNAYRSLSDDYLLEEAKKLDLWT